MSDNCSSNCPVASLIMKALSYTTLLFLILLTSSSCKKDALPKATQTGANIMAAKVNGQVWEKKACWSCTGGGDGLIVNYEDRDFFAVTGQDPDQGLTIALAISSLKNIGVYQLSSRSLSFARVFKKDGGKYYYTSATNTGQVTITKLDLTNKIASGTFEFTAEDENNPANTIRVTDGRFDVTFL